MKHLLNKALYSYFHFDELHFASPVYFYLIPIILILYYIFYIWKKDKSSGAIVYSNVKLFENVESTFRVYLKKYFIWFRIFILIILIIALARPQAGRAELDITTYGVDIMLAIDTSGSMAAIDMDLTNQKTRLDITKEVVKDFITNRKGDRVGIVVFGTNSFTQCPLTTDYQIFDLIMENIKIAMAGDMTNISMAIINSLNRLKKSESKSKIIILLTDGKQTVDEIPIPQAVSLAKTLGVKIYTIGIGTQGLAPYKITDPRTGQTIFQQAPVEIDFDVLRNIALETGGKFYKAIDKKGLKKVYDEINQLEKSRVRIKRYMNYEELFIYFLALGFGLIIIEFVITRTILGTVP